MARKIENVAEKLQQEIRNIVSVEFPYDLNDYPSFRVVVAIENGDYCSENVPLAIYKDSLTGWYVEECDLSGLNSSEYIKVGFLDDLREKITEINDCLDEYNENEFNR